METTLDLGCVWEVDGKLWRIVGREGFSDGCCIDVVPAESDRTRPTGAYITVYALRTGGKFVRYEPKARQ